MICVDTDICGRTLINDLFLNLVSLGRLFDQTDTFLDDF